MKAHFTCSAGSHYKFYTMEQAQNPIRSCRHTRLGQDRHHGKYEDRRVRNLGRCQGRIRQKVH